MFHDDEDRQEELFAAEGDELVRRAEGLDRDLAALGIHIDNAALIIHPHPDGPRPAMVAHGHIGRLAFSDRVQRPEQEHFDDAFADVAETLIAEKFEQTRRALLDEDDGPE